MLALVLVAVGVTAVGLQIVSRLVQRYSIDARRPDPLIDISGSRRYAARPPELERLTGILADSLSSDRIAASHLRPLLESLAADAPRSSRTRGGSTDRSADGSPRRLRKRYLLDQRLDELEEAWGVVEPGSRTGAGRSQDDDNDQA